MKELREFTSFVIDYRGKTPLKLGLKWSSSGYRALSAKNIKTGRIVNEDSIYHGDETLYKAWMKDEIRRGDILITSEAPFGEVFYWDSDEKIILSQRLFCLRPQNRVILYDDKILIFYNTDDNHPTIIKRKDTEELISHLNDIARNGKTATDDCLNATGNNSPIVQKENSLEPQGFKRVSLGGK